MMSMRILIEKGSSGISKKNYYFDKISNISMVESENVNKIGCFLRLK